MTIMIKALLGVSILLFVILFWITAKDDTDDTN